MEYKGAGDTSCSWCTWNGPQKLEKKNLKEMEIRRKIEEKQLYHIYPTPPLGRDMTQCQFF